MMLVGCDVALRNSHDALRVGRETLERANPPIRGFNRAVLENFVSAALVQIGELAEAESSLRAALPHTRHALGTARTTLCYVSFLLARQGRCADAAQLLGAVDALRPPEPRYWCRPIASATTTPLRLLRGPSAQPNSRA